MSALLTSQRFPVGQDVRVYEQEAWGVHERPPTGPPPKGAKLVARAKKHDGGAKLGKPVKAGKAYYAYAEVNGEHRYVAFFGK